MFDLIVGVILALFIIHGLKKGFFDEALGLVGVLGGIVVGIVAANALRGVTQKILPGFLGNESIAHLITFVIFFIAFYFLARFLAGVLRKLSDNVLLSSVNKLFGSLLGGLKGALVIGLVLNAIAFTPYGKSFHKSYKNSYFYKPLYNFVPVLYKVLGDTKKLPEKIKNIIEGGEDVIGDTSKKIEKKAKEFDRDQFDGSSRD